MNKINFCQGKLRAAQVDLMPAALRDFQIMEVSCCHVVPSYQFKAEVELHGSTNRSSEQHLDRACPKSIQSHFFFWHRDMLYRVCDLSFSGCILPKCPLSVLAANGLKYFFLNVFKYSSYIDVPLNRGDVKK